MKYSLIIPVYNRPDEVRELLESLTQQTLRDFEVIVVDDGSTLPCEKVVQDYEDSLDIHYFSKPNSGPGQTRNYGVERASGEYCIVLDSDCVLPPGYLSAVEAELQTSPADAFGGPDRAHDSFTPVQKAINYSMTSFFTTGGIRGSKKKKMDKFYPRSFNMGIKRSVYENLGGFSAMRFGEDIDFSIRIFKGGYRCRLFPEAWVWHKRRTDLRKFFRQVCNSGIARINLYVKYPESLKVVHVLPCAFTLYIILAVLALIVGTVLAIWTPESTWLPWMGVILLPLLLFTLLVGVDATVQNKSVKIGLLSIVASYVQLTGYGSGFIRATVERLILHRGEFSAFEKNFYK
jgi:glycosyltransferase involved in cell wall biosynthesis